ncbi:fatty-acyl-CoA synthase [Burkholderiales bacterium]|nr:fatty-acyl-CoA synthase [Burkholderiales bacterium]
MQTLFRRRLGELAASPRSAPAFALPGREIGYPELVARVDACAAWLARAGCRPEEVVGITIADEVTHLVASLALLSLGVPQTILATHDPAPMRSELARRLGVRYVVVADPDHRLSGCDALVLTPDATAPASRAAPSESLAPGPGPFDFHYTSSGTTGKPKIFGWDQRTMAWRGATIAASEGSRAGQRSYIASAVEHRVAQCRRLYSLYSGITSVLQAPAPDAPLPVGALCADLRVDFVELSVLQVQNLLRTAGDGLPSRTTVYVSGSRVPAALRRQFRERHGAPFHVHYGASEVGRVSTTFPDADDDEGVGRPVRGIDVEIVDGDGRVLPAGEVGEIRVRAECMARGYHDDPEATARHFRDGWFHPGDFARRMPDGTLRLAGRADEMMNLNGIKIFPAEIERVLESHPSVRAAVAFAQPSAVHGDIPVAAVELVGGRAVEVDDLLDRARAALGVRAPRRIVVLDALPRNAAGKVLKHELVARVLAPSRG